MRVTFLRPNLGKKVRLICRQIRVVGGMDTLSKMEKIETDKNDKPLEEIKILKVIVFVDPFQEVDDQLLKLREQEKEEKESLLVKKVEPEQKKLKTFHNGVGKYIDSKSVTETENDVVEIKKKKNVTGKFGDFSSW